MISENPIIILPLIPLLLGSSVSIFLLIYLGSKENFNTIRLIGMLIPCMLGVTFSLILANEVIMQMNNELESEKKDLLGLGCKQLKQVLEDIITEKIKVHQDSEELASQLLLVRCT